MTELRKRDALEVAMDAALRDKFMLAVLPHLLALGKAKDWNPRAIAVEAYRLAEALIAERG